MRNVLTKVAIAATVLMGVASTANAFVILRMTDTVSTTTKSCNTFTLAGCGAGGFTITDPNFVTFNGVVGAFDVRSTQGVSNAPGNALVATANTTSLEVKRNDVVAGTKFFVVDFISFDFFSPTSEDKTMQGSASTTAGAGFFNAASESVFTDFRVDSNNGIGAFVGATVTSTNCLMATALNNSCNAPTVAWSDPNAGTLGFSTRTQQGFTLLAGSIINTTSSLTIRNVPEPMTLSLVGMALVGMGFAARRRSATSSKA